MSPSNTIVTIVYFHWTYGVMWSVPSLPWEHILVWNCTSAGAFKIYTYPTNRIVGIEKSIPTFLMVIYTAMRTHTGKKPAKLQVLSGFIYPKPQLFVMTNIFPLVLWWLPLSFCSAMRTHAGEKPEQLQVLSECTYPTNMIACNEKRMPTILIGTCAQVLHCHESTYWWETCTTTGALRMFPSYKHWL